MTALQKASPIYVTQPLPGSFCDFFLDRAFMIDFFDLDLFDLFPLFFIHCQPYP
jgi:hypothetical protein